MADPTDNFHCFEGNGLRLWRAQAIGMAPKGLKLGPDGAAIDFATDVDGIPAQNGGMFNPQITKMKPGRYYRFFGTITQNLYGKDAYTSGGWWVDFETFCSVKAWASEHDIPLSKAAQRLLVIPGEWHDCGYIGCAELKVTMKAFVGKGQPATGSISPDSLMRDKSKVPVHVAVSHLETKQYFVPGTRDLLGKCFTPQWSRQVIKKGVQLPV